MHDPPNPGKTNHAREPKSQYPQKDAHDKCEERHYLNR